MRPTMTQRPDGPASAGDPPGSSPTIVMSRRQFMASVGAAGVLFLSPSVPPAISVVRAGSVQPRDSVVIGRNDAFLQGVRESKLGPPMVARALAIGHTCIYDAWAAYDARAVGTRLGGELRRPAAERTVTNKACAISFAAYRAGIDLFP